MADDDEIDIINDFSFNSCFAQNNQGIPSCSDREDTVHPQWLLDSTANNWYDVDDKKKNRRQEGTSRILSGNNATQCHTTVHTTWSSSERKLLKKEMAKHGRDIDRISKKLKSKSKAEIQALIEAEHGITLDTPVAGLVKYNQSAPVLIQGEDTLPAVIQEEVVLDEGTSIAGIKEVMSLVSTGVPTITTVKKVSRKKHPTVPKSLDLNPDNQVDVALDHSEIFYEDELLVASTELVTSDNLESIKSVSKKVKKKFIHNKKAYNYDKAKKKLKHKEILKCPQGRHRKDSNDDSIKNPKMHIVLGSGQALPVSEGEEVIKIEKKKESESETDIEIDVGTDEEDKQTPIKPVLPKKVLDQETKKLVATRKFEPMPKRNRKINLVGSGGYTIMHTEEGDMYEIREEPRKEKPTKKPVIQLYPCRVYNSDKPAPFMVCMHVSTLVAMDAHAHTSRAEVAGLLGGDWRPPRLLLRRYRHVHAAAQRTHCDMDPVSQAAAGEWMRARGCSVVGWHHSHPAFPAAPSATDLRSQQALQALPAAAPALALITSQHWPVGRAASHYRCIRVEETADETDVPVGYQLSVKLVADLSAGSLPDFLHELRELWAAARYDELRVDMAADTCPQAGLTYVEKLVSSASHHMRSAGYDDDDVVVEQLMRGIRDVFR